MSLWVRLAGCRLGRKGTKVEVFRSKLDCVNTVSITQRVNTTTGPCDTALLSC